MSGYGYMQQKVQKSNEEVALLKAENDSAQT